MDKGELLIYQGKDGLTQVSVRLEEETVWLNMLQMAELFQRDKSVISRHIANIVAEGELEREATVAFFATVQQEGKRRVKREVEHYNLDMIISVGYRVHSHVGVHFRRWATEYPSHLQHSNGPRFMGPYGVGGLDGQRRG